MTPLQIAAEISRLEILTAAKGYYLPKITVRLNWVGYELTADIEVRTDANTAHNNVWVHTIYADGFEGLFDKVAERVAALPSIEDAKRNAFIASVGRLIDQGKEIGIDVNFLNPLTEMMTKLSTNIITKQKMDVFPS